MKRRWFLAIVVAAILTGPLGAEAGPALVGLLAQDLQPGLLETFQDELRRRGHVEGRNIHVEVRNAAGHSDRLPALVDELIRAKAAVIGAVNTPAARAAKKATATIPIVILRVADPVRQGLVSSLAHPGGNVTGLAFMPDVLGAKGVEMLHQILPSVTRVASLYKADNPGALLVVTETARRSLQLGLHFLRLPVAGPADLPAVFETAVRARTEAVFVMDDGAMTKQRKPLLELAARHSLPVVSIRRSHPEGCRARTAPDRAAPEVRPADQSQDRQGPRDHDLAAAPGARRRDHRVAGSTRISVFTELAMKHCSCAWWWSRSTSAGVGAALPP